MSWSSSRSSAPGYKTVRYWLTFDRETHLMAHLDRGTGQIEATEEQTLVALGELPSSTSAPAVAAITKTETAKADVTKTIERSPAAPSSPSVTTTQPSPATEARLAPRKIGRGEASESLPVDASATTKSTNVHVASDQAAPMVETAAPPPAPPPPPPASEPAPAWTGTTPATTTPPATTPAPPSPPATTTPPVAAKPAVAAAPSIVSPKAVRKTGGDAPQIIMDHYDGDDLPSVITAKLCIDTSGHVASAVLLGKVQASRLGSEIAATLRTWTYAPYVGKDGKVASVCFPVALRTK